MSDWAAVVLVLGLCALSVAVYAVRALIGVRAAGIDVGSLKSSAEMTARNVETLDKRCAKIEAALRIDGAKLMAEANRAALPAMFR